MLSDPLEDAFANHLGQIGAVTSEQLDTARRVQQESSRNGMVLSLGTVLVQQGIITETFRENIEKKIKSSQQRGLQQLGNYKLLKKLGEGGMGAVYLADDIAAGRKVALKILPKKFASDAEFINRFKREARATGKLNHPNIIAAFSVSEELGYHFYVMEYCEGESLDVTLLRERCFPWDNAVNIAMQVAQGLKHAHENGFIHRDIKPANLLMTKDGVIKILDLGLSKSIENATQSFHTQNGIAVGTPHYISPEQARGEKDVDKRTDVYSLGATFYQMVTGETPYQGESPAIVMVKHLTEQIPNPQDIRAEIPDSVVHVIQKMMAKNAIDRYADCARLLTDLELLLQGQDPVDAKIDPDKSSVARLGVKHPKRVETNVYAWRDEKSTNLRVQRPGTRDLHFRKPKSNQVLYIGLLAAGLIAGIIAYTFSGRTGPETALTKDKDTQKSTPKIEPPAPVTVPAPEPAKLPVVKLDIDGKREQYVQRLLDDLIKQDKNHSASIASIRRGYAGLAKNHGFTKAGKDAAEHLKSMPAPEPVNGQWIAAVRLKPPAEQLKMVNEKLEELNSDFEVKMDGKIDGGAVVGVNLKCLEVTDISPLKAFDRLKALKCMGNEDTRGKLSNLSALKGMQLSSLSCASTHVGDLSALRGMPLNELDLGLTDVADLSPLAGMPLQELNLSDTKIESLAPLKGLALNDLDFSRTAISDLAPIKDMHLQSLGFTDTKVADIAAIKDMPVKELTYDVDIELDAKILKAMGALEKINDLAVKEFWKRNQIPPAAIEPVGQGPAWHDAIDLLAAIDPQLDKVSGDWSVDHDGLSSGQDEFQRIEIPYQPAEEYDFKIVFTPLDDRPSDSGDIIQMLSKSGKPFLFMMGGWGNKISGIETMHGKRVLANNTMVQKRSTLQKGQTYTAVVQVRNDSLQAYLNGRLFVKVLKPDYREMSIYENWSLRNNTLLGLGSFGATRFSKIEVLEIKGKGKFIPSRGAAAKKHK